MVFYGKYSIEKSSDHKVLMQNLKIKNILVMIGKSFNGLVKLTDNLISDPSVRSEDEIYLKEGSKGKIFIYYLGSDNSQR